MRTKYLSFCFLFLASMTTVACIPKLGGGDGDDEAKPNISSCIFLNESLSIQTAKTNILRSLTLQEYLRFFEDYSVVDIRNQNSVIRIEKKQGLDVQMTRFKLKGFCSLSGCPLMGAEVLSTEEVQKIYDTVVYNQVSYPPLYVAQFQFGSALWAGSEIQVRNENQNILPFSGQLAEFKRMDPALVDPLWGVACTRLGPEEVGFELNLDLLGRYFLK